MGKEQSKFKQEGYVITKQTENYVIATKEDDTFFIKMINLNQLPKQDERFISDMNILKKINNPHVVDMKNSFKDVNKTYYVIMDHCQGGSLAVKINNTAQDHPKESQVLSWFVEICIALKTLHEAALYHKELTPKKIFFTEFGMICLSGFGNICECSQSPSNTTSNTVINYLAPEVFTRGTYDARSDIWSLGCILFELCTKQQAFSAETTIKLIPKVISGDCPSLPNNKFSSEVCDLLGDLLKKDPLERPTVSEILAHPIVLRCLMIKSTETVEGLQSKLEALRALADGLEQVHVGTTIGSLTGGVIGAVGGVTSIVGLILAPFTLGASLIVTGVGVGVGALGGITAGASNITNMVNQSSDRKAVHRMIKEIELKIKAVVTWLLEINSGLETISSRCPQTPDTDGNFTEENLVKLGFRAGRGLHGISELIRLARVATIGKIAAQASRTVRVAEVATGVFSFLFVAVDIFFIAMDAKEIHHIREAREAERNDAPSSGTGSETGDSKPTSDQGTQPSSSVTQKSDTAEKEAQTQNKKTEIRSEIMKFVQSVREAADNLENVLTELETIILSIPLFPEDYDHHLR